MSKKKSADRLVTKERILEVAEQLYAEHGLNAVSLRQIGVEAGARNTNAVQYHFVDAAGLIGAILERHSSALEMKRAQLLAKSAARGPLDLRALMEVLYRPILECDDSVTTPVFARFSLVLLSSPIYWESLVAVFQEMPVSGQIIDQITELNQPIPASITFQRILYVGISMLSYSINTFNITQSRDCYEAAVTDGFAMAAAAMNAPVEEGAAILAVELQRTIQASGKVLADAREDKQVS